MRLWKYMPCSRSLIVKGVRSWQARPQQEGGWWMNSWRHTAEGQAGRSIRLMERDIHTHHVVHPLNAGSGVKSASAKIRVSGHGFGTAWSGRW